MIGEAASSDEWGRTGGITFSPDSEYLATTNFAWQEAPSSLTLWDTTTGAALRTLLVHPFLRGPPVFSEAGHRIAAGTCTFPNQSSNASVFDVASGDLVFATPPAECGHAVDLDPTGDLLAVLGEHDSDNVQVWDLTTKELVAQVSHRPSMTGTVQFSPDGTRLLTTGADGFGRIWEVASSDLDIELEGHSGPVDQGVWASDDTVATVSGDKTARLWDARTGENLLTLPLEGQFPSVAVSPDGRRMATSAGGHVRVWTLDLDELLSIATSRLSRSLSSAECITFHFDDCPRRPGS